MKKRIIALFALVAMMATMLTIPVGAEIFVNDTFDNMTTKQDLIDAGWKPYDYGTPSLPDGFCGNATIEGGAFKIEPVAELPRPYWRKHYTASQNHIAMFDLKAEIENPELWTQLYLGSNRVVYKAFPNIEADTWYTVMIVVSGNATQAKIYYRKTAATDDIWNEYKLVANGLDGTTSEAGATSFIWGFISATSDYVSKTGTIWYDNFRVFSGDFVDNFEGFKLGTTKIDDITEINAAGTLKADYEVYTDDVSFVAGSTIGTYKLQSTTLKTIMVSFDKNMRMLDCDVKDTNIKAGSNPYSNQLTLSDTQADDKYYGNIADGGYVGLYLWKGMQPLDEALELN